MTPSNTSGGEVPGTAHTPGPLDWCASSEPSPNHIFHLYLVDGKGRKIAALWGSSSEKIGNARLFSNAPELLESVTALCDLIDSVAPAYSESTVVSDARMIAADAQGQREALAAVSCAEVAA